MCWFFVCWFVCFLVWLKCKKGDLGGRYDGEEKERESKMGDECSCSHPAARNEHNVCEVEARSKQELNSSLLYLRRVHLFYFCPSH